MTIPVLIVPAVSRFDLLERLIRSLDEPVERLVIVDNSCSGATVSDPRAEYIRPITGLGYPGGINAGIMQTPAAPWWLFASVDIEFGEDDLAAISSRMNGTAEPRVVTGTRNDSRMLRWAYGALNVATVRAVGLMDEHAFYPIYFDDDDYERRCKLAGIEWLPYDGDIRHGDDGLEGSVTIKSDAAMSEANTRTFALNRAEYHAKWGGGPTWEAFDTPWDSDVPLSHVRPDPAKRAARLW
jgi:GT2 family glycosyltransferase